MSIDPITQESPVLDTEVLYRAVRNDSRFIAFDSDGRPRISSMAFNDPGRRPSVDRAALCSGGPAETRHRFASGSGVLSLLTQEVRSLTATYGGTGAVYGVDVEPAPLEENLSHAEIFGRPPFDTDKVFERIKQALARIATLTVSPGDGEPETGKS